MSLPWSFDGTRNGGNRSFVKNQLDTVERLIQQCFIRNAAFDEIDVTANFVEVLPMAGRQVVENANACAACDQG